MMSDFSIETNVVELTATLTSKVAMMDGAAIALKKQVAQNVLNALPGNMHFRSGNGTLEGSFYFDGNAVRSDVPYSHRREFSFHGPDSRGRMYPNDPAGYFMRDTLQQVTSNGSIDEEFTTGMSTIWGGE